MLPLDKDIEANKQYFAKCDEFYKTITDTSNIIVPTKEYIKENQFGHVIKMYLYEIPVINRNYFKDILIDLESSNLIF